LLEQLGDLGETYTHALRLARDVCGERGAQVILPAAALALRYEHPGNSFVEIVRRIAAANEGGEIAQAKKLAGALPSLEGAGSVLGTAVQASSHIRRQFRVYQSQMEAMRFNSWGIDELDLLVNPKAIEAISTGALGFGIVTQDSVRGLNSRGLLVVTALMLRGGPSIPSVLREIQDSELFSIELRSNIFRNNPFIKGGLKDQ
jgi:hypothetical protein